MRFGLIKNGEAVEVMSTNPSYLLPESYAAQFVEVPDKVFQGWRLVDGKWQPPLPPPVYVPQKVTIFQGTAAMLQAGILAEVEAYMALESTPALTKLAWNRAQAFERQSDLIQQAAAALGLSDSDIDALFIAAEKIS